jgi:N-acetylmuramoyl-L-alanine amidase
MISKTVKAKNVDDIIVLNNIVDDRQITEDFERQNNGEEDLDNLLEEIVSKRAGDGRRPPRELKIPPTKSGGRFVVVLDAGHGGMDPGALGIMGSKEKDINLEFAKILEKELKRDERIKVHLLRHNDVYIGLKDRIIKARDLGANLLISLHSDSNSDRSVRGLTVYRLAETTLNRRRRKIADDVAGQSGGTVKHEMLGTVMEMFRNDNFGESIKFANTLVRNFKIANVNMLSKVPKSANFGILVAPEFPSVLIELGFISNLNDEMLLKSTKYKIDLAKHIARSVEAHFLALR